MNIRVSLVGDGTQSYTVAGIFHRTTDKVNFLTTYYNGNAFIGFSPSGTNFVYDGDCFEGKCGMFIKDSETLANKFSILESQSRPEENYGEEASFVRWISDNEIEYKLGTELKQVLF